MSLDANTQPAPPTESAQPNSLGPAVATPATAPEPVAAKIRLEANTVVVPPAATPETRPEVKPVATQVTTPTPAVPVTAAATPTPTPAVPVAPAKTPVAVTPVPTTAPAPTLNRVSLLDAIQSIAATSISRRGDYWNFKPVAARSLASTKAAK